MDYLTADQIMESNDLLREEVPVQEWGGVVLVRGMTGQERDQYERSMLRMRGQTPEVDLDNLKNIRARLAAWCMIDSAGNQLFGERQAAKLGRKSALALDRVYEVVQRLSGLSKDDIKELEGN